MFCRFDRWRRFWSGNIRFSKQMNATRVRFYAFRLSIIVWTQTGLELVTYGFRSIFPVQFCKEICWKNASDRRVVLDVFGGGFPRGFAGGPESRWGIRRTGGTLAVFPIDKITVYFLREKDRKTTCDRPLRHTGAPPFARHKPRLYPHPARGFSGKHTRRAQSTADCVVGLLDVNGSIICLVHGPHATAAAAAVTAKRTARGLAAALVNSAIVFFSPPGGGQ